MTLRGDIPKQMLKTGPIGIASTIIREPHGAPDCVEFSSEGVTSMSNYSQNLDSEP